VGKHWPVATTNKCRKALAVADLLPYPNAWHSAHFYTEGQLQKCEGWGGGRWPQRVDPRAVAINPWRVGSRCQSRAQCADRCCKHIWHMTPTSNTAALPWRPTWSVWRLMTTSWFDDCHICSECLRLNRSLPSAADDLSGQQRKTWAWRMAPDVWRKPKPETECRAPTDQWIMCYVL
jgi:hypothetical protein